MNGFLRIDSLVEIVHELCMRSENALGQRMKTWREMVRAGRGTPRVQSETAQDASRLRIKGMIRDNYISRVCGSLSGMEVKCVDEPQSSCFWTLQNVSRTSAVPREQHLDPGALTESNTTTQRQGGNKTSKDVITCFKLVLGRAELHKTLIGNALLLRADTRQESDFIERIVQLLSQFRQQLLGVEEGMRNSCYKPSSGRGAFALGISPHLFES